jgi:hypothetical protein
LIAVGTYIGTYSATPYEWDTYDPSIVTINWPNVSIVGVGNSGVWAGFDAKYYDYDEFGVCSQTVHYEDVATANESGTCPNVDAGINFEGVKQPDDNLMFSHDPTECSESLGLAACGVDPDLEWHWNVEMFAHVSDDASQWTISQQVSEERQGYWFQNGNRVPFNFSIPTFTESPDPSFVQGTPGTTTLYSLDAPSEVELQPCGNNQFCQIDTMEAVVNFSTNFCSVKCPSDCFTVNWHYQLLIYSSDQVDTNSNAGYGSLLGEYAI